MLLDLHMPVMSGIEVCMYVRGVKIAERCTNVPVTAGAGQEDQELLRTLGNRHFLVKDENLSRRVEATLKSVCAGSQLEAGRGHPGAAVGVSVRTP
jgi:CheY-like chemotaxis protein